VGVLLMFGRLLSFVLCPALLAASGCTRSDDGTVIIPSRMDVRRVWDRAPPGTTASRRMVPDVFPEPPGPPPNAPQRRYVRPVPATPHADPDLPSASSEPEKTLACRNVSGPGRRYRVVCD
jgi:hypothetical protein